MLFYLATSDILSNLTTQTLETSILSLSVYKNALDLFLTKEGNRI